MGKRFKGLTCAYCSSPGISSTGDHVIPRRFFPKHLRENLPQVPACAACNNAKSIDEHYLATVLPFGGNHPESAAMLEHDVPPRLMKNRKLHQSLTSGVGEVRLNNDGISARSMTLPIEAEQVSRFTRRVIQGMHAYHWEPVQPEMWAGAGMLSPLGIEFHNAIMHMNGVRLRENIGNGLFSYAALRSFKRPFISAWWLKLFGGVMLGGDSRVPGYVSRDLWGIVSIEPVPEMFDGGFAASPAK